MCQRKWWSICKIRTVLCVKHSHNIAIFYFYHFNNNSLRTQITKERSPIEKGCSSTFPLMLIIRKLTSLMFQCLERVDILEGTGPIHPDLSEFDLILLELVLHLYQFSFKVAFDIINLFFIICLYICSFSSLQG